MNQQLHANYAADLLKQTSAHLEHWFSIADRVDDWAIRRHLNAMTTTGRVPRPDWSNLRTNRCCLFCLVHRPEYMLPCRHAICDACVRRFGTPQHDEEHCFKVSRCLLCQATCDLRFRLKPPTAGARILSIDGGGIRGVIPLQTLTLLQASMGDDCPIRDFIDVAFGTSAGWSTIAKHVFYPC